MSKKSHDKKKKKADKNKPMIQSDQVKQQESLQMLKTINKGHAS